MQQLYIFRATRILIIAIAVSSSAVACRQARQVNVSSPVPSVAATNEATPVSPQPVASPNQAHTFELALDKAAGAHSINQSARSPSDWLLVASQYRDAIALLRLIEENSPFYGISQTKIAEYERLALAAQKRAQNPTTPMREVAEVSGQSQSAPPSSTISNRSVPIPVPPVAVASPRTIDPAPAVSQVVTQENLAPVTPRPATTPNQPVTLSRSSSPSTQVPKFYTQQTQVFSVPIKRRAGGTPVIEVTFNGTQKFEMIVDTGASGTVITQSMADALRVVPVTISKANTASAKGVEFPIGYVNSMEANGIRVGRTAVAIASNDLETGLLGHDFFDGYDVTIRRHVVEFRPHSKEDPPNSAETQPSIQVYPKPRRLSESP
ncbi:retropepsin-like aspartic protease family protein [Calothrix sp. NIES-3974]|uniref:retropepsin-like aspartic protease family protein n=1 Tax=Calothrix sp. NIES-3974 TaxID=2005462 RepID=UPI000B5FA73D|nr:retropepsin-like aspartic protease [Calothrix sp. NIES-3974]BAZ06445.1 hypothetical protein NIES3974_31060 [Calothrix sp. NIES-3974]